MARRGFTRGGGVKPPQRQIASAAITGEVNGIVPVAGLVKIAGTVGLQTIVAAGTIVRTRGELMGHQRIEAGADQIVGGAFGIIMVSGDAFAAGTASMPGPLSDSGDDWYVWVPFNFTSFVGTAPGEEPSVFRTAFDSRGMRKTKGGEVAAPIIEIESVVGGGVIDFSYTFRDQVKL